MGYPAFLYNAGEELIYKRRESRTWVGTGLVTRWGMGHSSHPQIALVIT
jgi:hypothetical protein